MACLSAIGGSLIAWRHGVAHEVHRFHLSAVFLPLPLFLSRTLNTSWVLRPSPTRLRWSPSTALPPSGAGPGACERALGFLLLTLHRRCEGITLLIVHLVE